ncbi:hypothetical protein HA402_008905 [Bradysia odoriphaga]|nr:hypothetical protein HA402_008905 [Bradysia odoriphaga]
MVGSNELRSGGTYYEAERLISHENYNIPKGAYDVALVKVREPIEFNDNVSPIELDDREVPDGAEVQLTGWGNIEAGYIPNNLQFVNLHILLKDICKKARFGDYIQDHHVCTISLTGGACRADSGGPLVYDRKLVGIVNFGLPCGLGNPDVYAKVSSFADWIRQHSSM